MTPPMIVAILLALGVALGWVRLLLWQRAAPVRSRAWRLVVLAALPALAAVLLHRALFPTHEAAFGTLVVATQGAPRLIATGNGETLVALPEARGVVGAERVPDLGTALRLHGARMIRVVGSGLVARDRVAARAISLRFAAPAPPTGLIGLVPPAPTAPGEAFAVTASIAGGGAAALVDPAGRIVDRGMPDADGMLTLRGVARAPGTALFTLRLADSTRAAVPLVTDAAPSARVLILAAAPGPEVKFLRRWASDAGLAPDTRLPVGNGLALGDPGVAITPAMLSRYDAVILDDRTFDGLRGTLAPAVRAGLGVIVRVTGPVARGWNVMGLATGGGSAIAPLRLAPLAPNDATLTARRGPGTRDAPVSIAAPRDALPELTRQAVTLGGIPLLRDARGTAFASWRGVGRGRVALVTLHDSFALVTSGNGDAHADLWSKLISTVGRGTAVPATRIGALPRVGERIAVCAIDRGASVIAPDGRVSVLETDGDCAGYWPSHAGWHRVTAKGERAFYVYATDALSALRATERREATLALVGERAMSPRPPRSGQGTPSIAWFAAFLVVAALLWWVERARFGRRTVVTAR